MWKQTNALPYGNIEVDVLDYLKFSATSQSKVRPECKDHPKNTI